MTSPTGPLRVAFRADASIEIGTGHVMRCLTLAAALAEDGAECVFLCRRHDGHLLDFIAQQGHRALALPERDHAESAAGDPAHAHWLGAGWQEDAEDSLAALAEQVGRSSVDWLVVDHYALDARWEGMLRPACARLMVIDDIADRPHACDLLLDQNLGRVPQDYDGLVPPGATVLLGPKHALLRPEFAHLRPESLARRADPPLQRILVTLGGIDKNNATVHVLDALDAAPLPDDVAITVVMGPNAPWLDAVRTRAARMGHATEVLVGVSDMARLMVESDLAIGAGGATTWERCALGVPAVQVSLAENQRGINLAIGRAKAALQCEVSDIARTLSDLFNDPALRQHLAEMSRSAALVTDGQGTARALRYLLEDDA